MARQAILIADAESWHIESAIRARLETDAAQHPDDHQDIESVSLTAYTDTSGDYPHHQLTAAITVRYRRKES